MNQLKFNGNSGCDIKIINDRVRKYSSSIAYNARLKAQISKQKDFKSTQSNIYSPTVFSESVDEVSCLYYCDMDFINGLSFVQLFSSESFSNIVSMFDSIFSHIEYFRKNSKRDVIDKKLFEDKKFSILTEDLTLFKYVKMSSFLKLSYPVNVCHGDLTLSNILFKKDSIYFIDFLDSFLETYYQDLIKLRQDLKFHWSLLKITDNSFDKNKINQILFYLNDMMTERFSEEIESEAFAQLELMNYLRIIPYAKEDIVISFLKKTIKELL